MLGSPPAPGEELAGDIDDTTAQRNEVALVASRSLTTAAHIYVAQPE